MVVCDVTSESKDMIKQLEDANVNVLHRSRTKKDSSDEVLRQQMRKLVDTSSKPGRIVLISGDSDFSTDLHSFRFTKLWEIVLIHNAGAKEALKMVATHAFSFDNATGKKVLKPSKKESSTKETKKENKKDKKEPIPSLMNLGGLNPKDDVKVGSKAATQTKGKKALVFRGKPNLTPKERDTAVEAILSHLKTNPSTIVTAANGNPDGRYQIIRTACLEVANLAHATTLGVLLEHLVVALVETSDQSRALGGQLLETLASEGLLREEVLLEDGLLKLLETATDMDLSIVANFWGCVAEIFCPCFRSGLLPLSTLREATRVLRSEKMVGELLAAVLNTMAGTSKLKTHKAWKDSGLKWSEFVASPGGVEDFLETHGLRWLGLGEVAEEEEEKVGDLVVWSEDEEESDLENSEEESEEETDDDKSEY